MEKQMTLPRIRPNNEKIIFRIGTPMLANPTSVVPGPRRRLGRATGGYEDDVYYYASAADAAASREVLADL